MLPPKNPQPRITLNAENHPPGKTSERSCKNFRTLLPQSVGYESNTLQLLYLTSFVGDFVREMDIVQEKNYEDVRELGIVIRWMCLT